MSIDVVMPRNNEAELLQMSEKLGFKELIFLYDDIKSSFPKISSEKIKIYTACLINNIKEVDKAKKNFDLVFAPAQRNFFENKKIKYLINAELSQGPDFLFQKRAGLDDVMARLAKENEKTIVFNLALLKDTNNLGFILGRMQQNARLCRKYKLKILVATLATNPLEMRALKDLEGFMRRIKLI